MEQPTLICPQCSREISPQDTVVFGAGRLAHLDCGRTRILSSEERALLSTYCRYHRILCAECGTSFPLRDLVLDFGRRTYFCPWCRRDLTDSVRGHLYQCALLPETVRCAARAARDTTRILVKETQQLRTNGDVLMRQAEAASAELRETIRKLPLRNWQA